MRPSFSWWTGGAVLGALALLVACAGPVSGAGEPVDGAKQLYDEGMEDLEDGLYPEALEAFSQLKAKFPYSRWATLADLRTGDTHFERGKYLEAIDAYRSFLKYHPTHEEAAYAMMRIADSYYEQVPEDWLILPPAAEKDQASTRLAISAYRDMLARFGASEHAEAAQARLTECRRKLADHEIYVAKFYFDRDRFLAAAGRAEGLLRDYPGLGLDAVALFIAGASRLKINELDSARQHLRKLVADFADTEEAGEAKQLLAEVDRLAPVGAPTPGTHNPVMPGPAPTPPRTPAPDGATPDAGAAPKNQG